MAELDLRLITIMMPIAEKTTCMYHGCTDVGVVESARLCCNVHMEVNVGLRDMGK